MDKGQFDLYDLKKAELTLQRAYYLWNIYQRTGEMDE